MPWAAFLDFPEEEEERSANDRLGEKHRVEGQHLSADRNHQRNALNSVPHVSCPANFVICRVRRGRI
jgi:hypothetical protein